MPFNLTTSINHPGFPPALSMLSELFFSYSKTTSFLLFIITIVSFLFIPQHLKLGAFSDYKGNMFSFRKFKQHWKPDYLWKSTDHKCANQGVHVILVICPTGGRSTGSQMICFHLRRISTQDGQQRSQSLHYCRCFPCMFVLLFTMLFLNYRQLDTYITVRPFSDTVDTSVYFEWHWMVLPWLETIQNIFQ